jgi:hypothetical protein
LLSNDVFIVSLTNFVVAIWLSLEAVAGSVVFGVQVNVGLDKFALLSYKYCIFHKSLFQDELVSSASAVASSVLGDVQVDDIVA